MDESNIEEQKKFMEIIHENDLKDLIIISEILKNPNFENEDRP